MGLTGLMRAMPRKPLGDKGFAAVAGMAAGTCVARAAGAERTTGATRGCVGRYPRCPVC